MLENGPLVSLLIPAYQAERFLGATLACALAQTYPNLEIVVLNNNSTDSTPAILSAVRDPRLRVESNSQTLQLPDNWNRLVEHAKGDLIKVLCADDLITPDCIATQVAVLSGRDDVALVSCRTDFVDEVGLPLRNDRGLSGITGPRTAREVIRRVVRSGGNPIGPTAAVMFRRNDFDTVGGFDGRFYFPMELELWTRLLTRGSFVGIDATLASFRVSASSQTSGTSAHAQYTQQRAVTHGLVRDPRWRITVGDRCIAAVNAQSMQLRRNLLYRDARRRARR